MSALLQVLTEQWRDLKELEKRYQDERRKVEDRILEIMELPADFEGVKKVGALNVTTRTSYQVDAEKLKELASEHGLEAFTGELFRWKADLNLKAWKNFDESKTRPLLGAITTKQSRPSFTIKKESK